MPGAFGELSSDDVGYIIVQLSTDACGGKCAVTGPPHSPAVVARTINPLMVLPSGQGVKAVDALVVFRGT